MKIAYNTPQADALQARYGLRVAARLSAGLDDGLPHDISERLRVARQQAVARRKQPRPLARLRAATAVSPVSHHGGAATLGFGDDGLSPWGWLATGVLAVVMAVGLITINVVQEDDSASELADVDSALLTDDLPPQAYADPGFAQFLKTSAPTTTSVQ